jgi:phosphopantetheine adenylyltransferase
MMIDFSDLFLQISNTTIPYIATQPLVQQVQDNTATATGAIASIIAVAGGLISKHVYDNRKREDTLTTASDIDKMQMADQADNYNDFAIHCALLEQWLALVVSMKGISMDVILDTVVDDVTKETMGQRLIKHLRAIQDYNQAYYRNVALKPNSTYLNSKNPLKNVRSLVRDMTTPS